MSAITIHDLKQTDTGTCLAFDLIDLLQLDEVGVRTSDWRCRYVECMGEESFSAGMDAASDDGAILPGNDFVRLASGIDQVIDGDFAVCRPGAEHPWLVIRAVDCTFFIVATKDERFLDRVRGRFHDVRDAPEEVDDLARWW